jgi:integrase
MFPALLALKQNECNMAYLYRKNRSPFWYIQYIDADKIKHDKSTVLRADDPNDTAKAKAMRAELEANEHRKIPLVNGAAWDNWVLKYFERHCPTKATLDRYEDAWKWVALWLQRNRIHSPRQLTYRLAIEYLNWRTTFKKRTGKIVGRNTAILELKLLSLVMGEAVRLGHADANPLVSMKLKRDKAKKKPEMTDNEIIAIQDALKQEPEWMQIAFEIALQTGCRLRETRIPLSCVDFRETKITFPSPKGGEEKAFSIPMPTVLMPLLEKLKSERKSYTLDFPFQPSRRWQQFFIKLKLTHLCFHCLRVTYINRLRRAGVPREAAMRLVNHASALVHEIYQREKVDDVMQWRDAVKFPISKTSLVLKPALPTVPVVAIWRKESETEPVKILS